MRSGSNALPLCRIPLIVCSVGVLLFSGCGQAPVPPSPSSPGIQSSPDSTSSTPSSSPSNASSSSSTTTSSLPVDSSSSDPMTFADVLAVETSGNAGAYQFSVTIQSPDTGCDQYANWWEVVSEEGALLHRRVLFHSHVNEQPFSRSSGPVSISDSQSVIVRAHMHPHGYGGQALKGSVAQGFNVVEIGDDFAVELAEEAPLPNGCTF